MQTGSGVHRFEEVDSLRGLAALFVVFFHCLLLWNAALPWWLTAAMKTPLSLMVAGSQAVYLFFVMSGFVLFLPYKRPKGSSQYSIYVTKRVCRIYLPYLPALLFAVAADLLFYRPVPGFYEHVLWIRPFSIKVFIEHILFLGVYPPYQLNLAFWSLVQEMRLSLIYPLIAFIALRSSLLRGMALSVILVAVGSFGDVHAPMWFWLTLNCTGMFIAGATLARHLDQVMSFMQIRGGWFRFGVFLFALIPLWLVDAQKLWLPRSTWVLPCHVIGVILILILALTTVHFKRFLHLAPMRWLGKVSYSLYLLHGTVLYSLYCLYWPRYNHLAILATGILLSLGLSAVFYQWVELPSMLIGRKLAGRISPKSAAA
jgi:peptidoglycan/LPS O-acetylase OafA/YrhL